MGVRREVTEIWDAIDTGQGFTSVDELCRAINVSPATAYNCINNETLPSPIKIGGRRLFVNAKLKQHLAGLTEEGAS